MDAAVSSLAAADVGADVLEDFEARGGGGRHVHAPAQPPRRVAPTHVSLLSRAIPRSVFADSEVCISCCCPMMSCHSRSWRLFLEH